MRRLFNTATVKSTISYIDGDKGILRYRGYPIEQLAEKSSFLEVARATHSTQLPVLRCTSATTEHQACWCHPDLPLQ
jgi:citrate synthase